MALTYFQKYESPLGRMIMAGSGEGLAGLWFEDQKYFPDGLAAEPEEKRLPVFELTANWLDLYFSARVPDFTPPLDLGANGFRRRIRELLLAIPYGGTTTYGALARQLAAERGITRMSAQAVGGAVGHNNVAIIVPCHRVIGADGSLTGYAGGIERKKALLELERTGRIG